MVERIPNQALSMTKMATCTTNELSLVIIIFCKTVCVKQFVQLCMCLADRLFSKMAAKNSNKLKLKTNTKDRKSTFTLVTLQSFSISGVISAEKI